MEKISHLTVKREEIYPRLFVFRTQVFNIQPNSELLSLPIPFGLMRNGFVFDFATEQEHLAAIKNKPFDFKAVQRTQTFAMDILSKSEKINKKPSGHSYGLKHVAEGFFIRHFGYGNHYVANGDFILAMYLSGYEILKDKSKSLNCWFNVSETSIAHAQNHTFGIPEITKQKFNEAGVYDVF